MRRRGGEQRSEMVERDGRAEGTSRAALQAGAGPGGRMDGLEKEGRKAATMLAASENESEHEDEHEHERDSGRESERESDGSEWQLRVRGQQSDAERGWRRT